MNRRSLFLAFLLGAVGCAKSPVIPERLRPLLGVGRDFGECRDQDEADAAAELRAIVEHVHRARNAHPEVSSVSRLNQVIFSERRFAREVDDPALEYVLLPGVLRARRGSCVGLGCLYLALGELLGLTCAGVLFPGHFFVRAWEGGRWRNIELLRRGEEMPDSWYRSRYPAEGRSFAYDRALSWGEVLGVVEYDIGNERQRQGRLLEARRAYQRATHHFPTFAEAHASLGAAQHLLGELALAEQAYRAAARENPSLPGLSRNLELLLDERAARAARGAAKEQTR